jgi:hypothetical protein
MRRVTTASWIVSLGLAACGGATESPLLEGAGSSDASTQDVAQRQDTGGGGPDASTDAAMDGREPFDGDMLEASEMDHHKTKEDSGGDTGTDSEPTLPPVYCGAAPMPACPVPGEECCVNAPTGGITTYACISSSDPCANTPVSCDKADDCGGLICCGTKNAASTGYKSVSCAATCNGTLQVVFCGSDMGAKSACPYGYMCKASTLLPGYWVCDT